MYDAKSAIWAALKFWEALNERMTRDEVIGLLMTEEGHNFYGMLAELTKVCPECGKRFVPGRSDQVYWPAECTSRATSRNYKRRVRALSDTPASVSRGLVHQGRHDA